MKNKKTYIIIIIVVAVTLLIGSFLVYKKLEKDSIKRQQLETKKMIKKINNHYNKYVIVNKNTNIYEKNNNKYKNIGTISKNKKLILSDNQKITKDTKYFKIENINYYINYKDIDKTDEFVIDQRYKNYIPFNENIKTKEEINLYQNNNLILKLTKKLDTKIIEKADDGVYIEYNNEEYLIKNSDIESTYQNNNSESKIATEIPVTVYHFIYPEQTEVCDEEICHKTSQVSQHFTYLTQNNYFTLTTTEILKFLENKINLPEKSILITIDDGARAENVIPLLEEFKVNATLFLVSSWYPKEKFKSDYLEIASHTHNLHTPGMCSGGQGSPLKCLDKVKLQEDLKTSKDYLNTEAFCYPFYEYNDYAIENLKEVGFKMAFAGGMKKVNKQTDKYKIPRITMFKDTTLNEYINLIK